MPQPFSAKFGFVLKALSLTRSQAAAELGVDKSIVGRWATGAATPTSHNLSRLTALVAARAPGFTTLDWERDLDGLASALGVDPSAASDGPDALPTLALPFMEQILATTALRGDAYEGFFRSTRPYSQMPGRFIHDHMMIRKGADGLLRLSMATAGVFVEGWVLTLQQQLFVIGAERTSGAFGFGIFNGVNGLKAGVMDGIIVNCALDAGRTPTAFASVLFRLRDLSGDVEADDRHFAELAASDALVPEGGISDALKAHLVRDIGPAQIPLGGDWLLRMPLARSMSDGLHPR